MGQDIGSDKFRHEQYIQFRQQLDKEMATLSKWFESGSFCTDPTPKVGLEVEAWLTDKDGNPAAKNASFLKKLNHELVVPELSSFNIEVNTIPQDLTTNCLSNMHKHVHGVLQHSYEKAQEMGLGVAIIGSLPTLKNEMLNLQTMSHASRYEAINNGIMKQRHGVPLKLDIHGKDHLLISQPNIMLEAAATSLQAHLKVPFELATKTFNNSLALAAITVGVAANSPYLFGHDLWDETRIPIFEQGVRIPCFLADDGKYEHRVTFGHKYFEHSLKECFDENSNSYPILLPELSNTDINSLPHTRLHNGNIWRWNRPILGFEANGKPHLRIEHRTMAAGPTVVDMVANLALYFGMVFYLNKIDSLQSRLPFKLARNNFYAAAKNSLRAKLTWFDGKRINLGDLVSQHLLIEAKSSLIEQGLDKDEVEFYIGEVIGQRIATGGTGAAWQRKWVAKHGKDFHGLVNNYQELSHRGDPVHEWHL